MLIEQGNFFPLGAFMIHIETEEDLKRELLEIEELSRIKANCPEVQAKWDRELDLLRHITYCKYLSRKGDPNAYNL